MLACLLLIVPYMVLAEITPVPRDDITPIPQIARHEKEFRRLDANNDNKVTFSEFIMADRPYMEEQSRHFHKLDQDGDGTVAKKEFEQYYKQFDHAGTHRQQEHEHFFDNMENRHFESAPFFEGNNPQYFLENHPRNQQQQPSIQQVQQKENITEVQNESI